MREMAATGDLTRRIPRRPAAPLGGRGCPAPGDHLQHDDRLDRALPARGGAARAAVVARAALDRRRARDPQPADDHQDRAAQRCAARTSGPTSSGRRSPTSTRRSRGSTASCPRCSTSPGRSSSTWRPTDLNALCEDAARAADSDAPADSDHGSISTVAADRRHRRRAAAAGARQHPDQRATRRRRHGRRPMAGRDPIRLTTRLKPRARWSIEVRDQGTGIASEDLSASSIPYFTTRRTGTGLGLAISRNIIEGLGGTIGVSSRPGEGTEVRMNSEMLTLNAEVRPRCRAFTSALSSQHSA